MNAMPNDRVKDSIRHSENKTKQKKKNSSSPFWLNLICFPLYVFFQLLLLLLLLYSMCVRCFFYFSRFFLIAHQYSVYTVYSVHCTHYTVHGTVCAKQAIYVESCLLCDNSLLQHICLGMLNLVGLQVFLYAN